MDSRDGIFKTSSFVYGSGFLKDRFEKSDHFQIRNPILPRYKTFYRKVTGPVTFRPSKTIDGEGGQESLAPLIFLTTLTQQLNNGMEIMGVFGFRRAEGHLKKLSRNEVFLRRYQ